MSQNMNDQAPDCDPPEWAEFTRHNPPDETGYCAHSQPNIPPRRRRVDRQGRPLFSWREFIGSLVGVGRQEH